MTSSYYYWGEPELAPHRRVECSQSIYYYYYVWYVRHPRYAIYIVQQLAIYSGGPHEETYALSRTTCPMIA